MKQQKKSPPATEVTDGPTQTAAPDTTPWTASLDKMIAPNPLLTIPELAEMTGISPMQLREFCHRTDDPLPSLRFTRQGWFRVYYQDFIEWSKRNFSHVGGSR